VRIILAFLALLSPGLAWWAWLGKREQDPLISLAHIIGVSIALILLTAELVFVLGGSFSPSGILVLLAGCGILSVLGFLRRGVSLPKKYYPHLFIGLVLFGLAAAWRLYQARELLLPNWVDSQHHYLIIRTILENGGLPGDLSPYLSVPLYYHFGFHALTALFTALSGLEIGPAMLLLGQVLNALIGLSVYALGKALWKDWQPATAAALLVTFAVRMPAYYLSWGRYTLTTGLVLLPLAMGATLRLLHDNQRIQQAAALALLTAGVLLSHYFTALLLGLFLVLLTAVHLISQRHQFLSALKQSLWAAGGAVVGLLLAAPWLRRAAHYAGASAGLQSKFPASLETILSGGGGWDYIWKLLGPASNHWLLLPAGVGLLIALIQRRGTGFALWSIVLGVLALPWTVALRPFRPDHFAIVLFLPVSLWAGWLFWWIGGLAGRWLKQRWVSLVLISLLLAGWTAWGYAFSSDIINPVTVLVTEDDLDALAWVETNTPTDARFYINTTHWQNNTYRGVDGGGWLLPLTGRWALVPTVFYGFSPDAELRSQLRDWGEDAGDIATCSAEFWALVEEAELDWIYIREGAGSLQPEGLVGCEGVREVYGEGGVKVYKIN
jgi:hypothetical protein